MTNYDIDVSPYHKVILKHDKRYNDFRINFDENFKPNKHRVRYQITGRHALLGDALKELRSDVDHQIRPFGYTLIEMNSYTDSPEFFVVVDDRKLFDTTFDNLLLRITILIEEKIKKFKLNE